MPGYVVDVKAKKLLSQFMTAGEKLTDIVDEAYRLYAKDEIIMITILPEKGKN